MFSCHECIPFRPQCQLSDLFSNTAREARSVNNASGVICDIHEVTLRALSQVPHEVHYRKGSIESRTSSIIQLWRKNRASRNSDGLSDLTPGQVYRDEDAKRGMEEH